MTLGKCELQEISQCFNQLPLVGDASTFYNVPKDAISRIFNETVLSIFDLGNYRTVCKSWLMLLQDREPPICHLQTAPFSIQYKNPQVTVFGTKAWEKFFGYKIEGEIPPPPSNIIQIVRTLRNNLKEKIDAPDCSLLLMPKGLTLNKLKELVALPLWGEPIRIHGNRFEEYGNKAVEQSYWVLITNDVIEESREKSYDEQKVLIATRAGSEYNPPRLLEVVVCCSMNYKKFKKHIFDQRTCTRCQEYWGGMQMIVGEFGSSKLLIDDEGYHDDTMGVAVRLKLN